MAKEETLSTRIPIPFKRVVKQAAERQNMSVSRFTRAALVDAVADTFGLTTGDGLAEARELENEAA